RFGLCGGKPHALGIGPMSVVQTEFPESAPTGRSRSWFGARASVTTTRWLFLIAALIFWEIGARLGGNPNLIAPPSSIFQALFAAVLPDPDIRGAILLALFEVVTAYVLAIAGGLVLGVAIGSTNLGRRGLYPIVLLLYAIPQVVLLPLFTLGFGIGPAAKIAF